MLQKLHERLRASLHFHRFTALTRMLLALGFIPPGVKKIFGLPFTILPVTNPVGYFFDAFFQAEEYYVFIGLAQVAAGLLLLFPRTALLGAVLYFPIILNIAVITWSIGFQGTWVLSLLMTLASLYLLVWDYGKVRALLPDFASLPSLFTRRELRVQVLFWTAAGVAGYGLAGWLNLGNLWTRFGAAGLAAGAVGGALFGLATGWHLIRMPGEAGQAQGL